MTNKMKNLASLFSKFLPSLLYNAINHIYYNLMAQTSTQ